MFRTSFRVAALTVALHLSACAPPEMTPTEDDQSYVAPTAISQELGPEGGEIIAPDDGPLAGVKLRVPAGALSAKTTLTIDRRVDAKSLQGQAERVGKQVVVGPADVTFAVPVELTVPIDERELSVHEQTHDDCKVWFRTDGDWARLERKASVEGSITVELPSPGVAAAGVLSRTRDLLCTSKPQLCLVGVTPFIPPAQRCTSATGYCIVKLPTPQYAPIESNAGFNVVGRKLYYAHSPADDRLSIVRYDLDTGDSVLLGTVNTNRDPFSSTPVAVESDGSAWVGLGSFGNVKFKQNTVPFRYDFETPEQRTRDGLGVVVTGGKTVRIIRNSQERFTNDFTATRPFPQLEMSTSRAFEYRHRPTVPGGILARTLIDLYSFTVESAVATEEFQANSYQAFAASFVNAGFATIIHEPRELRWRTANGAEQRTEIPLALRLLAFDANDLVYMASTQAPELTIVDQNGGLAALPLTTAAAGTPQYLEMSPRALVGVPGRGEVLVQVNGTSVPRKREFYLVRKSN